ncbi:MAG: hypothetical protein WBR18_14435 [Anaerolineales bacterium]
MLLFAFGLAGCARPGVIPQGLGRGPTATAIPVDGGTLRLVDALVQRSYQTHYSMTYPPERTLFLQLDIGLHGLDDAEAWLQRSMTVVQDGTRFAPTHVRRRLVGNDYAYRVDEGFIFSYKLFYPIEPDVDPTGGALVAAH